MLIYGLDEKEESLVKKIVDENVLPSYSIIMKSMSQMKIKDIIEGFDIQVFDNNLPDEKVILFNNFSDDELEKTIKSINLEFQKQPILAVITPTSINWTFGELINHLIEEREWFKQHSI